ncbi:bromodomain-containing protein 4 [Fundulus heteroclitus]|uniref:bromodomain-containing protein 4 n=1 Tax=Fundulus heteroclitus TaxID=8078 RepID=UPI00165C09D8|nr:bromodomain-containing protein 4 [Fundulus heteroclitus]
METTEMEAEPQAVEEQPPPNDLPPDDLPLNDQPLEDQPLDDQPLEDQPLDDLPLNDQPPDYLPSNDLPPNDLPPNDQPPNDLPPNDQPPNNQPSKNQQPNPNPNPKKKKKKKQPLHSADIVFSKGNSFHTLPSLSKLLKTVPDTIVGLQYVWEYRSPSKSIQPHYQCKLCALSRVQHDMVDHVKGWKHSFRYLKKAHPDKATWEEEEGVKDPVVRRAVKAAAAEVEKAEGRGQIRVILKEPHLVPAFKGLRSATPKAAPPPGQAMGPMGPPFGPRFQDRRFQGEFPSGDGPGYGGYMSGPAFPDRAMNRGPFSDGMGPRRDGYGRGAPMGESHNTGYTEGFQGGFRDRPMSKPMDRPGLMEAGPESNSIPAVLKHLDSFRIENENDAQLVLKVTQKLTDVLMEYRLRSIPSAQTFMRSTDFPSPSPTSQATNNRYSSNISGPPRYPDGPQRFFK